MSSLESSLTPPVAKPVVAVPSKRPLPPLVLASASPQRQALLAQVGLQLGQQFDILPADLDEEALLRGLNCLPPAEQVKILSAAKAKAGQKRLGLKNSPYPSLQAERCLILAADTVVVFEGQVLGKPADETEARQMLWQLQGQSHFVYTGLTLLWGRRQLSEVAKTQVWLRPMGMRTIERYVATEEPFGKAGSYAIQGLGALATEKIEGCYSNVVGLPLALMQTSMERLGLSLL